jgi:hypothetical protein
MQRAEGLRTDDDAALSLAVLPPSAAFGSQSFTPLTTRREPETRETGLLGGAFGYTVLYSSLLGNCGDSGGDTVEDHPIVLHRSLFRPGSFPASG